MSRLSVSTVLVASTLAAMAPAFAQTAPAETAPPATAPAATGGSIVITAPEGYTVTEIGAVTVDQLKGARIYDPEGKDVGEIADIELGADGKVGKVVTDVGGFLGIGEHRVGLDPTQIQVYKNANNELRAYVTATKDQLKALPAYTAPQP